MAANAPKIILTMALNHLGAIALSDSSYLVAISKGASAVMILKAVEM